jgi:hypothetical protein
MPLDSIWARQLAGYFEDFFHGSGRKPQGMPVQERQARSRSDLALLPAPDPSAASYTLPDGAEDGAPPETTACTSLEFWPVAPSQPRQRNSEVKLRIAFAERDCYKSTRPCSSVASSYPTAMTTWWYGCVTCPYRGRAHALPCHSAFTVRRTTDGWITLVDLSPHAGGNIVKTQESTGLLIWRYQVRRLD